MNKGLIADIQRASFHDGYGIRTTVFFKGCPLSCAWCHNPECISFEKQMLSYPHKCIGCGKCDEGCYCGAKIACGREYTAEALLSEIIQDKPYYANDGGVTFSGGEPMAQREFLLEIIDLCKKEGISCAVETSMVIYDTEIFEKLDFVMADMKIWDNDIHKQYTGVDNIKIKENFKRLDGLGIPIIARTPVITEINQGIPEISNFLKSLNNVVKYELLQYHPLGIQKAKALNIYQKEFKIPEKEYMKELEKYVFVRK